MGDTPLADPASAVEPIVADLIGLGVLSTGTQVTSAMFGALHESFPVPCVGSAAATAGLAEEVRERLRNVILAGRFAGRGFFMNDVLTACHDDVGRALGNPGDGRV
jgi:hypothetical protein